MPKTPAGSPETGKDEQIAAIRAEGLTGRQLRMARRVAQKHGIEVESDFDAVRILRNRGIDPFKHSNMLELVVGERGAGAPGVPQTMPQPGRKLATPGQMSEDQRAREILKIQRDIARRRRRQFARLLVRLSFFVFLPTVLAGYYFAAIATPMYATQSEFVIQQADAQSGGSGLGSLFSGTGLATSQDSTTVQSYLKSREAMLRLDAELGFKEHFSDPAIDPIQRLAPDASNEDAYDIYLSNVKISYDPTEGIIKLEVIAASPEVSAAFSRALIAYAEEQVDQLTQRLREGQMSGARESFEMAETKMRAAQRRVVELQEQRGILSAEAEISSLMSQIATFEIELRQERLSLQVLMDNASPNQARVVATERNISRLEELIAEIRAQMTESGRDTASLAQITGELILAEAELQNRQILFTHSLQQMENARVEANRQVRYIKTGVNPIPPDEPTYPRAFENTAVAFLIFAGIYLMVSLTVSVLREQVSA